MSPRSNILPENSNFSLCQIRGSLRRHRASRYYIGKNKAALAPELGLEWAQDVQVTPKESDIAIMTDVELQALLDEHERVWDATANPLVRRKLSALSTPNLPVVRSEIYHGGRLGVTLMTNVGSDQNLNHLFHQLIALAMNDDWIKEWLAYAILSIVYGRRANPRLWMPLADDKDARVQD